MVSVRICSPAELDIAAQWDDLVRRAAPNVFMNPAALKAAHDTAFSKIHVLQAWDGDSLVGLWALRERKISPLWPAHLEALPYDYAFLASPVIDPAFSREAMRGFALAIAGDVALPTVVSLRALDAEAPDWAALQGILAEQGCARMTLQDSRRPIVTREFGVKRSGSTRKKLRQDWNRLAALGAVDVCNERAPEAVAEAFEHFLRLEAASWKGGAGTALLCDPHDALFVRRLVNDLAAQRNASVALLRLDGRAVAAQVVMYCGATAYTWKTAFDAEFARFSPGALLVDKVTEDLFAGLEIAAIDSCSAENSFMSQLWAGRRPMIDVLIDVAPGRSLRFMLEAERLQVYQRLRTLRDRLRAAHWMPRPRKTAVASQP